MNYSKTRLLVAGLGFLLLAGLTNARAAEQDNPNKSKVKPRTPPTKATTPGTRPGGSITQPGGTTPHPAGSGTQPGGSTTHPGGPTTPPGGPTPPGGQQARAVPLISKPNDKGGYTKTTPSGQPREIMVKKPNGEKQTEYRAPTGRVEKQVVQKPDGTQQETHYAPNGKVQKEVVVNRDGSKDTTNVRYDRDGKERAKETIKADASGRAVSKTVVVKNTTIINNTTIVNNNTTIVKNYDRGRYGYVYRPVYVVNSPVFVSWYDPYWYTPGGVVIVHPFRYSWGWNDYGWYHHHRNYWVAYDVYPSPCFWVTDWLIAGYVADRYAESVSVAQAREDARLARAEAERAQLAGQQAQDAAEIAEAHRAREDAERRAANAETRAARAEAEEAKVKSFAGKPNPKATPIDEHTKAALNAQIEKTIAEKKEFAAQAAKEGKPVIPDVSQALADPKHIYPVSKTISVISAANQTPAGTLSEGDLLKVEPGQENNLKSANETTFVNMRVMTSKGEEGEVTAGTLISVPLRDLQEFDSEFRAKLDLGLAEADKNKDLFKQGAQQK